VLVSWSSSSSSNSISRFCVVLPKQEQLCIKCKRSQQQTQSIAAPHPALRS
jgi:hypothetical protein